MKHHSNSFAKRVLHTACLLVAIALGTGSATVSAKDGAHVHGAMQMNVAVQAQTLTVQIEAPLDSLLGFEHAPRTAAQRAAADALVKRLNEDRSLVSPAAAAMCSLVKTTVDAAALKPADKPADKTTDKTAAAKKDEDVHADIDIGYEFNCTQIDKLDSIAVGLFDAFKRLQKIDAQAATGQGQSKQTLTRKQAVLKLKR
jgi:hypothetical protein